MGEGAMPSLTSTEGNTVAGAAHGVIDCLDIFLGLEVTSKLPDCREPSSSYNCFLALLNMFDFILEFSVSTNSGSLYTGISCSFLFSQ